MKKNEEKNNNWRLLTEVGSFTRERIMNAINETSSGLKKSESVLSKIEEEPVLILTLKEEKKNIENLVGKLAFCAYNIELLIDYIKNGADSQIYARKDKK